MINSYGAKIPQEIPARGASQSHAREVPAGFWLCRQVVFAMDSRRPKMVVIGMSMPSMFPAQGPLGFGEPA